MVVRSTKKAAPAKKATPAAKPAPVRKPAVAAEPKITAHDVVAARRVAERAQQEVFRLETLYWKQHEAELQEVVEHAEKSVSSTPKRTGRKPADTPVSKARSKTPVIDEFFDRDVVEAMGLREFRELAGELVEKGLISEPKIKKVALQQMEEAGLFREAGSGGADEDDSVDDDETSAEDEEDEEYEDEEDDSDDDSDDDDDDESDEDDDDEDEDDEDGYTLDDLKAMKLKQLQDLAEQNEIDVDGMSKSEIIEALLESAEDEEDDDEDEEEPEDEVDEDDDEEEEDEDDEETIEIDLDDLKKMSVDELYTLAKQVEAKIPVAKRKDKKFLIAKIEEKLTEPDE